MLELCVARICVKSRIFWASQHAENPYLKYEAFESIRSTLRHRSRGAKAEISHDDCHVLHVGSPGSARSGA